METKRIHFINFWPGFDPVNNLFTRALGQRYDVVIDDEAPEYLFYSVFGGEHFRYKNCVKIFFTGENSIPNFNVTDYALGFHFIDFEDRYLRFPFYLLDDYSWNYLDQLEIKEVDTSFSNRKFCNFVYSNNSNADPFRDYFYLELSKYKRIDSGGKRMNNMGERVKNKLDFIKDYKFTIAFENSSVNGYTTEKIVEPMIMNSMPIYWGNRLIDKDFNPKSFVYVRDKADLNRAIERVIELDNNDDLYIEMLKEPWFTYRNVKREWEEKIRGFLFSIFDQTREEAIRRPDYGMSPLFYRDERRVSYLKENYYFQKICGLIEKF